MNSVAQSTQYPVACPGCSTINVRRAADLLARPVLHCRQCAAAIHLNETQLNKVRRTVADLADCLQRSASMLPQTPPAAE